MNQNTFKRYALLSQVGLILIFFLINLIENLSYSPLIDSIVYSLNYTFMVAVVVILHYIYLLKLYLENKKLIYFLSLFSLMTAAILLYYFIDSILPFEYDETQEGGIFDLIGMPYDYLLLILITAYTSLYYFVEQWFKNISSENRLRNEKLQAEVNFLKSQINPHFLFNTLNNIYSYAQTGNKKTAPMLERLSSILRFMVYDCSEDRVGLTKEISAVEDLLEIHKMKNSEQRNIELHVEGVKRFHLIAPLILVNIVENACKHSDVITNKNGFIKVRLKVENTDSCLINIQNTYKENGLKNTKYSGIGLENIKKRLSLQFKENFNLKEEKSNGIYTLNLIMPLERKQ